MSPHRIKSTMAFTLAAACAGGIVFAAQPAWADAATMTNPNEIKWGDAPPQMPKGGKLAVLYGDPGKEGPFTLRLKAPAGYRIAPHWHSKDEHLTVISGTMYLGLGDKIDAKAAHALKAGGYHFLEGKQHHYAFTKSETIIQVSGTGPFDITYIDPADDPTKAH
jgi:quercetin dioxygenase-like cupin family protein